MVASLCANTLPAPAPAPKPDPCQTGETLNGRLLLLLAWLLVGCSAPAGALPTVTIASCYDGDTCRTTEGEKLRLACIDTPELRGRNADPVPATAARDYLRPDGRRQASPDQASR